MAKASETTRRTVIAAAGAAGLSAALVACGSDDSGETAKPEAPATQDGGDTGGSSGGGGLGTTAEVPEGGGKIYKDQKVVVTQPSAGQFKAFDATCTHQGCLVTEIAGGTINCKCHGSKFKLEDGSPAGGPATKPLAEKKVTVEGENITVA